MISGILHERVVFGGFKPSSSFSRAATPTRAARKCYTFTRDKENNDPISVGGVMSAPSPANHEKERRRTTNDERRTTTRGKRLPTRLLLSKTRAVACATTTTTPHATDPMSLRRHPCLQIDTVRERGGTRSPDLTTLTQRIRIRSLPRSRGSTFQKKPRLATRERTLQKRI